MYADGTVEAIYRVYQTCQEHPGPPCDTATGQGIMFGGSVLMRLQSVTAAAGGATGRAVVISSSDPSTAVGSTQEFELKEDIVTWAGSTYCGPNAKGDLPCGA